MSVPPPPPAGPPPGNFFGGPVQPQVPQYGHDAPAPVYGGYSPGATFGAPPVAPRATATGPRTPEAVTISSTLLAVFAAIGVYTLIAVIVLSAGSDSTSSDSGSTDIGLGAVYAVLWGGSGVINAAMIVLLRQGNAMARVVTSIICGLWTLYWLHWVYKLANAGGDTSVFVVGSVVHLGELLLLGLAVASALPAALLWRPSTSDHFS